MSVGLKRGIVQLEEHQTEWEENARRTIELIRPLLEGLEADIQHVGSTSIKTIKAKPIIDLVIGVKDFEQILGRNDALEKAGVIFRTDERPASLLYVMGNFEKDTRTHHIHVVLLGSREWNNYLNFRDYLNANPDEAASYESIKEKMAELYPDDRTAYTDGKAALINELLEKAGKWREKIIGHL